MAPTDELLDKQLEYGLIGDFENGLRISRELEQVAPNDVRAKFNCGWYKLREGHLYEGSTLMDYGRHIDVFGNRHIGTKKPVLRLGQKGDVHLALEGGLGDEIYAMRFIDTFKPTSVSCERSLFPIVKEFGVTVCESTAAHGLDYDYWVPAMSANTILKYEYEDVKGDAYISKTADTIQGRVGVRWVGNPKFEHQQHRIFPKELMFDAVKDLSPVSLQRDTDDVPDWMEQPSLETWQDTRKVISSCELVITSCTSVAHLAGAMGVETWIVVPILPYYLWALPTNITPHYDSVTLFRQEKYGCWKAPFQKIKEQLTQRVEYELLPC